MKRKSNDKLLLILIGIAIITVIVLVCVFVLKPAAEDYIIQKQIYAQNVLMSQIVGQIQEKGFVAIPLQEGTIYLTMIDPTNTGGGE